MGGGAWTTQSYTNYVTSNSINVNNLSARSVDEFYTVKTLEPELDPNNVMYRECCDSEEHPNTIPVILALDVTGSMGSALANTAKKLNDIITELYKNFTDIEIMVMGIGDTFCDRHPIQVSQFESDIRILDWLRKIYFERGGGGNGHESYSAAWYYGLYHTKLDCWNRGKKGIIITLGDEPLNPYLNREKLKSVLGNDAYNNEHEYRTKELYDLAKKKFNIYHVVINDYEASAAYHRTEINKTWNEILPRERIITSESKDLPDVINKIITDSQAEESFTGDVVDNNSFTTSTIEFEDSISW